MLNKKDIYEMLSYNIQKALRAQLEATGYYAYMLEVVLVHLRDILVEKGVRFFRIYLRSFDAVKYYKAQSNYNFSTWLDEQKLTASINKLIEKIEGGLENEDK